MAKNENVLGKVPPQNIEAEQSLLGALLIDKDAIVKIADLITFDDFYKDTHGMIFEAMKQLYERREPIDILSLANILEEKKQLSLVGSRAYLSSLANLVPTSSHIEHYAKLVKEKKRPAQSHLKAFTHHRR